MLQVNLECYRRHRWRLRFQFGGNDVTGFSALEALEFLSVLSRPGDPRQSGALGFGVDKKLSTSAAGFPHDDDASKSTRMVVIIMMVMMARMTAELMMIAMMMMMTTTSLCGC